jgi:hypothetical protein
VADGREQIQNARENPIQAQSKSNVENLLDLDLSAAPEDSTASSVIPTSNILDGLGGLSLSTSSPAPPSQVASSPSQTQFTTPPVQTQFTSSPPQSRISQVTSPPASTNNMDDLLGIFGGQSNGGFGGENVWSDNPQQNGAQPNKSKSSNEDILGLF